jgi:hypothetical protein
MDHPFFPWYLLWQEEDVKTWKTIGDRLRRPGYLSRVGHDGKIRTESKGEISENILLQTGPSSSGTNYLQMN